MNTLFFKRAVRVWLVETIVSGFNFFILMGMVYEPRWGELVAHQIGMITRIVYIFTFAHFLLRFSKEHTTKDLVYVGFLWLGLELLFEWGGSIVIGRPVQEILVGWNIFAGYMWPYVLLTYLFANLIVGTLSSRLFERRDKGARAHVRNLNEISHVSRATTQFWLFARANE